ncbi:ABC transporter permease [Slackia piriformis]|nr:ABC transporter permease [Slackia piriformis]
MQTALEEAIALLASGDEMLVNIVLVTLRMSVASSLIALAIGLPVGAVLAMGRSKFASALVIANRTLMGVPPVVCGLLCYLMFCGVGPLRWLDLLYTVEGMVVAQVLLITPIVAGNVESYVRGIVNDVRDTARGIGLSRGRSVLLLLGECRYQVFTVYLIAFGRAIAEVGAVSMVGGAIAYKTNVMTTAIMMYTNRGDFTLGIALGIILLLMFLALNVIVGIVQRNVSS